MLFQAARGSWYASSNSWSSPSQTEQRDESAITIGSRDEDVVESSTSNRNMIGEGLECAMEATRLLGMNVLFA